MRPQRRQPTRLRHPWASPGKNTGVGCHFLLQCMKVKSLSRVQLLVTPWTAAYQAPPSMGFSRQEYWSTTWLFIYFTYRSVQFSSVAHSCPTLCDPMNCSTPGLPVHHQLPGFIQTHVHSTHTHPFSEFWLLCLQRKNSYSCHCCNVYKA